MSTELVAIGTLLAAVGALGVRHAEALSLYGGWTNIGLYRSVRYRDREVPDWRITINRILMGLLTILGAGIALLGLGLILGIE